MTQSSRRGRLAPAEVHEMNRVHPFVAGSVLVLLGLAPARALQGAARLFEARFETDADGFEPFVSGPALVARRVEGAGRNGSGALWLDATAAEGGSASWYRNVDARLDDVEVRVTLFVRGRGLARPPFVNVQAYGEKPFDATGQAVGLPEQPLTGDFDWTRLAAKLIAGKGTRGLFVAVPLDGGGELWIDDVSIETGGAAVSAAPGLFEVRAAYRLRATQRVERPRFLFPVPIPYRDQCPLSFEPAATPSAAIATTRFLDVRGNLVAEVVLRPVEAEESIELAWTSLVLCGPCAPAVLPRSAPFCAAWPEEALPWLASSLAVTSSDARFVELGREIRGELADVVPVLERALAKKREIVERAQGPPGGVSALDALERRGSCTSAANLLAALLRGSGVPARTLSGYPTSGSPLQTHYIVEAFVPNLGWYPIEATRDEHPFPNFRQLLVAIVPVEHEDLALERPTGGRGVPYLSLTEAPEVGAAFELAGGLESSGLADHVATPLRNLDGAPQEWAAALERARARLPRPAPAAGSDRFPAPAGARAAATLGGLLDALGSSAAEAAR